MRKSVNIFNHSFDTSLPIAGPDHKLLYFHFDDDAKLPPQENKTPKGGVAVSPITAGRSKLLDMVNFYENLNIILDDIHINRQVGKSLQRQHKMADSLQAVIDLIVLAVKPERIYQVNYPVLTGTDISQFTDLLIIIRDNHQDPFHKIEPFLEFTTIKHQHIFCTLIKAEKLAQSLKNEALYFSIACTGEHLVYSCHGAEVFPDPDKNQIKNLKNHARLVFYNHLAKGDKFLKAAKNLKDDTDDGIFMFMLHQAAELTLRGIILAFSGLDKRSHEIRVLLKHVHRFAPKINEILPGDTAEERYFLNYLDEAYLKSRYQANYSPDPHLDGILYPRIEQLLQTARESFKITMDHL